ncbi:MAG: DNA polymerase IV [Bacillota bacterium]
MRSILHVDLDAFFASVEQIDNPRLLGKPVVVGGTGDRGVVATCSYEARRYGIHSAMPTYLAKQRCPNAIFLPTRHDRYEEVSREVFSIFYELTDQVEPLSIDEAYIDVTYLPEDPIDIGTYIKNEVLKRTKLTISVGVSYNKFLAKLASDWNKPDGFMVITEDMIPDLLKPLPIRKVYGIGAKSAARLNRIGIFTIEDIMKLPKEYLIDFFGKYGIEVYDRVRGVDHRPVASSRERKSIGRETTLAEDTRDKEILRKHLLEFAEEISFYLLEHKISAKTVTIKIKTGDFENHTKRKTIPESICLYEDIYRVASDILDSIEIEKGIRLIGLTVSNLTEQNRIEQLSFFTPGASYFHE